MKKIYRILVCLLILALVVCGCSKVETNTTENTVNTDVQNEVTPGTVDISLLEKDVDGITAAIAGNSRWSKSSEYFKSHPECNVPNFADETDSYILSDNSKPVDTGLGIYISIPEEFQDDVLVEYYAGMIEIHDVTGEVIEHTDGMPAMRDAFDGCVRIVKYDAVNNDKGFLRYGQEAMITWCTDDGPRPGVDNYTPPEEYIRVLDADYSQFKDKYTDGQILNFFTVSDKIELSIYDMETLLGDKWVYTYYDVESNTEKRIEK